MSACPTCEEQVLDFIYDELAPDARARFEAHLHASADCAREARLLAETEERTRRRVADEPSPALLAGLKAEARKQVAEMRASRDRSLRLEPAAAGAALDGRLAPDPGGFGLGELLRRTFRVPVWVPALGALVLVAAATLHMRREGRLDATAPVVSETAAASRHQPPAASGSGGGAGAGANTAGDERARLETQRPSSGSTSFNRDSYFREQAKTAPADGEGGAAGIPAPAAPATRTAPAAAPPPEAEPQAIPGTAQPRVEGGPQGVDQAPARTARADAPQAGGVAADEVRAYAVPPPAAGNKEESSLAKLERIPAKKDAGRAAAQPAGALQDSQEGTIAPTAAAPQPVAHATPAARPAPVTMERQATADRAAADKTAAGKQQVAQAAEEKALAEAAAAAPPADDRDATAGLAAGAGAGAPAARTSRESDAQALSGCLDPTTPAETAVRLCLARGRIEDPAGNLALASAVPAAIAIGRLDQAEEAVRLLEARKANEARDARARLRKALRRAP